ncbi:MAG TPA: glycosyltransferase [Vicinamibacterales bacterium]|nr:glycosyltransferase [Vicinamibacterales bacterium]
MAEASLLPDEFVQQLMAVGQVDVLVGIPTLDNAATIAEVIKVVHRGFATYFPRDRTVLINSDGGSKDETRSIVRDLSLDDTDTLTVTHGLRTTHRISTPYHGVPGKGSALRQIFAAADLLQARAVAVLDPDVTTVTPDWIGALLAPVRQQAFDFVAPIYTRHPLEGPLVTQLIRPLMRAAYGWQVAEPQAAEFGCSGRFASHCLDEAVWDTSLAQYGIDIWTTGEALTEGFSCCQAALGPRTLAASTTRPGLSETFGQVIGSLFLCLEEHPSRWLARTGSQALPVAGRPPTPSTASLTGLDGERLLQSFGTNLRDLRTVLQAILVPETQDALSKASESGVSQLRFPDDLWAATVYQFLAAHHGGVMRREHVTQALLPLYLGRAGAFAMQHAHQAPEEIDVALESLAVAFERSKPYLVERWHQTSPR